MASSPDFVVPDGEVVTVTGAVVVVTTGAVVVVVTGAAVVVVVPVAVVVVVVGALVVVVTGADLVLVVTGAAVVVVEAEVVVVVDWESTEAPATPTTVDAATAEVHTARCPRRVDALRRPAIGLRITSSFCHDVLQTVSERSHFFFTIQ